MVTGAAGHDEGAGPASPHAGVCDKPSKPSPNIATARRRQMFTLPAAHFMTGVPRRENALKHRHRNHHSLSCRMKAHVIMPSIRRIDEAHRPYCYHEAHETIYNLSHQPRSAAATPRLHGKIARLITGNGDWRLSTPLGRQSEAIIASMRD